MFILGISAFYHDSAACLIKNGEILFAAQEERFTRIKHDSSFPTNSVSFCLSEANISLDKIDYVVFYEKPIIKFERLIETYLAYAPKGFRSFSSSMPLWVKEKIFQKKNILEKLKLFPHNKTNLKNKILFSEHHYSHAASAFFPSPFEQASILTMDGVGEWSTTTIGEGKNNNIVLNKEINFPHSLGLLYSAFTYYLGFKVNSGEYKVMGLAPYGEPIYAKLIKDNLIDIKEDGSFRLKQEYFNYCTGLTMTNKKFNNLFGSNPRKPEDLLSQREMDIAASLQKVIEEVILKIGKFISKSTGNKNLCLAGGVALNCVANGVLKKANIFENIWIQPASGDAGGALGAALFAYYSISKSKRIVVDKLDSMKGSFLGPSFSNKSIESSLDRIGASYEKLNSINIIKKTANEISKGMAVGWLQGRMEFGPRALGCRSILADPRSKDMQKNLNIKIKFRESFRPFAPSIIDNQINKWFNYDGSTPYMLMVADVKEDKKISPKKNAKNLFGIDKLNEKRSVIPAVTHVDYSARIQSVHPETNKKYYSLLEEFFKITGCPILVNTSFNVRGEPIVCPPEDAFKCFMGTNLDILVIENYILYKENQNKNLVEDYKNKYELD